MKREKMVPDLRPCVAADLDRLFQLDMLCFRPGIAYSRAELAYYLRHASFFSRAAFKHEQIVGFAIMECARQAGQLHGHLITIDVSPKARNCGIGTLLIEEMEAELRARRAITVSLEVAIDNEPAQAFYQRAGYRQTGRIPGYYLGKLDALTMEKTL